MVTPTPDFVGYPETPAIVAATGTDRWVTVTWADGLSARFHHVWLRDNCACAECLLPLTKEQTFELDPAASPSLDGQPIVEATGALSMLAARAPS